MGIEMLEFGNFLSIRSAPNRQRRFHHRSLAEQNCGQNQNEQERNT